MTEVPSDREGGTDMARKKRQTYSHMVRSMADIQKKIIGEKDRMAEVLASELDYDTALRLGDLSESELRRVARFMFDHIGMFVNLAKLDVPESKRSRDAEDSSVAEGELRYDHAKNCWDIRDAYMFGPDILVAPICHEKARKRSVYLPSGTFFLHAGTGERYEGGKWYEVEAALDTLPVFLREGRQEYLAGQI